MKHSKIPDNEFELFLNKHLNSINDLDLIIIKGHILIEYALNNYIQDLSDNNFNLFDENFSFSHKLKLCKAFGLFSSSKNAPIENLIIQFNKIRNTIAHTLNFDDVVIKNLFINFKKYNENNNLIFNQINNNEAMKSFIIAICGTIMGIKMSKNKINNFTKKLVVEKLNINQSEFIAEFKKFNN